MFEREEVAWLLWWTERGGVARFGWPECEERRRKEKTRRKEEGKHGMRRKRATVRFAPEGKTRTDLKRHGQGL